MMGRNTFAWGTQVGRSDDGPIPFLQYSPRLRHVAEFLFDLERWRDQRVVVLAIVTATGSASGPMLADVTRRHGVCGAHIEVGRNRERQHLTVVGAQGKGNAVDALGGWMDSRS